jgi:hypothetical protein
MRRTIITGSLIVAILIEGCGDGSEADADTQEIAPDITPDSDATLDTDVPDAADVLVEETWDAQDTVDLPWDTDLEEEAEDPSLCTVVIEAGGSIQAAADAAVPGDVICIRAGDYGTFDVTVSGTEAQPIVFKAYPGERRQARIMGSNPREAHGIFMDGANHIVVDGLWVDQVNQGIYIRYSDFVIVQNCLVTNIGQECLRFKFSDYGAFIGNEIHDCGLRAPEGLNGEGIYVGSGEENGDDTHGVLVRGNVIWNATDEGIELKGYTCDCVLDGNVIHDLVIKDGGAIHVATPDFDDPALRDSGHVVRGNITYNIQTRTEWSDGNGLCIMRGATVYNNLSFNNQHYGLRVDDKLLHRGAVMLYHNTLFGNGSGELGLFDGVTPDARNNLGTDLPGNMAASEEMFVNAAGGDFHLVPGAAAIDAGSDAGITYDLEGTPRPQGGGFDMGAYEFLPE